MPTFGTKRKGGGPTHPDEASVYSAEKRAGVYDDDLPDTCTNCDRWPCACDDHYDRDR